MPVNIRPLDARDREAWLPLWQGYLDFYETSLPREVTDETWRRIVDPAGPIHGLGAVDEGGRLIGIVHYLFHPATWSIGPYCYLEDLFVSPDARGSGAGRALIEAVYRAAAAANAEQVYWLTAQSNTTARKLYDRVGQVTPFIKVQAMNGRPPILGVLETAIYSDDLARAHSFYGGLLGLECVLDTPRMLTYAVAPAQVLLVFKRGATREDTDTPEGTIPGHHSEGPAHFAFAIDTADYGAWKIHLEAAGIAIRSEVNWARGGRSLYFDDPDGNVVELATPGLWPNY